MSVRDRIKAAEGLQADKARDGHSNHRGNPKLNLKTDERIKEEFLKKADGGWHKKIDVGQQGTFTPSALPPIIKLTVDTPVTARTAVKLPDHVSRAITTVLDSPVEYSNKKTNLKGALLSTPSAENSRSQAGSSSRIVDGSVSAGSTLDDGGWNRIEQMEAEQQAAIDAEAGKTGDTDRDRAIRTEPEQIVTTGSENHRHDDGEWDRVAKMEAMQQAAMEAETAAARGESHDMRSQNVPGAFTEDAPYDDDSAGEFAPTTKDRSYTQENKRLNSASVKGHNAKSKSERPAKGSTRVVPIAHFEDLLDQVDVVRERSGSSRRKNPSKSRHAHVEEEEQIEEQSKQEDHGDMANREKVLFDPLEWANKKQARRERRRSQQHARHERNSVEDHHPREHVHARSPSIRLIRVNDDDDDDLHERRSHYQRHRSRSRSKHDHENHDRASTSTLWPSFSNTERRSMGETFGARSSSHHRTRSDDLQSTYTTDSTQSRISMKKLEFAEYIAGKRLDHVPQSDPRAKFPQRPLGFVRSHSHTGEYSEGYTRERKLLRKPSGDEEAIEHVEHDWNQDKRHRRNSSKHEKGKSEPWQVKLLSGIARG